MTTLLIGRHPDCQVVLDDPTVSRRHADLSQIGPELFLLNDYGSTSGTHLLDASGWKRVSSVRVRRTDRVRFGAYETTVGALLQSTQHVEAGDSLIERDPITGQIVRRTR